ncbi:OmpH family outer membrane protein [Filimonas effusa]|uniref:OmpH family outer membrane protein n=1 Tax=Filimonas effusa TaxID=2508721 RepID=A0A4Q1CZM9_9BACT|nr:OmpH family outer membrane protein [Filimonas effusa]RXK80867.1 OmpH family outer membrane protein [Filimonas effusa]
MKKVLFSLLAVTGMLLASSDNAKAQAQQGIKIGVFDIEIMMQVMPEYRRVDSLVRQYEQDTLGAEYRDYQSEYQRLDSIYKKDSAAGKSKSVLDMQRQQMQSVAMNLVYWQQIAQNKSDQKRAVLAQPLYEKVVAAYKKVLDTKKYTLILKPNTFEAGTTVDNIFELVAKEMKIPLPRELGGGMEEELAPKPAQGVKPAGK